MPAQRLVRQAQKLAGRLRLAHTRAVIEAALRGDLVAARLVLDLIAPPARDRTVKLAPPDVNGAADLPVAIAALLREVGAGVIKTGEGEAVARLLGTYRAAMEMADFYARLKRLEEHDGASA